MTLPGLRAATIEISNIDIRSGEHGSCWCCPAAMAILRVCNELVYDVSVNQSGVTLYNPNGFILDIIDFPERVSHWIANYDGGKLVGPITFELSIPEEFLK